MEDTAGTFVSPFTNSKPAQQLEDNDDSLSFPIPDVSLFEDSLDDSFAPLKPKPDLQPTSQQGGHVANAVSASLEDSLCDELEDTDLTQLPLPLCGEGVARTHSTGHGEVQGGHSSNGDSNKRDSSSALKSSLDELFLIESPSNDELTSGIDSDKSAGPSTLQPEDTKAEIQKDDSGDTSDKAVEPPSNESPPSSPTSNVKKPAASKKVPSFGKKKNNFVPPAAKATVAKPADKPATSTEEKENKPPESNTEKQTDNSPTGGNSQKPKFTAGKKVAKSSKEADNENKSEATATGNTASKQAKKTNQVGAEEKELKKQEKERKKLELEQKKAERERLKEEKRLEQERRKAEREQKKMEKELKKMEREQKKSQTQKSVKKVGTSKTNSTPIDSISNEQATEDVASNEKLNTEDPGIDVKNQQGVPNNPEKDIEDKPDETTPEQPEETSSNTVENDSTVISDSVNQENSLTAIITVQSDSTAAGNNPDCQNLTATTTNAALPTEQAAGGPNESQSAQKSNGVDNDTDDNQSTVNGSDDKNTSPVASGKPISTARPEKTNKATPKFNAPKRKTEPVAKKEKTKVLKKSITPTANSKSAKSTSSKSKPDRAGKSEKPKKKKRKSSEMTNDTDTSEGPAEKRSKPANYCGPIWVQCDTCDKWRQLNDCKDPSELPDNWVCSMNSEVDGVSTCSAAEEQYSDLGDSQEFVESPFIPGSIVWAKMDGYPWWPAMLEEDPDEEAYYKMGKVSSVPVKYHAVFLDTPVCRAWVSCAHVQHFMDSTNPNEDTKVAQKYKKSLRVGVHMAKQALSMPLNERLQQFSFASRFHRSRGRGSNSRKRKHCLPDDDAEDDRHSSNTETVKARPGSRKSARVSSEQRKARKSKASQSDDNNTQSSKEEQAKAEEPMNVTADTSISLGTTPEHTSTHKDEEEELLSPTY